MTDLDSVLKQFQPDLEEQLKVAIGGSTLPLYDMMRYHLGWADRHGNPQAGNGGKRLRPVLCLLACQGAGADWRKALPAAAAIELVHNFSLIHDDIEDGSSQRRGRSSVWQVWGEAQAINAGDAMYALARLSLLSLDKTGVPSEKTTQAANLLDEACLKMCEGQYLDLSYETTLEIRLADYLDMIDRKTAALFRCSLEIGASLGMGEKKQIDRLAGFGRYLGLAFQMQNDITGIWGKSALSDVRQKKKTLPVVLALEKATGADAELLRVVYSKGSITQSDVKGVLAVLGRLDVQSQAQKLALEYSRKALSELDAAYIGDSSGDALKSIASLVAQEAPLPAA